MVSRVGLNKIVEDCLKLALSPLETFRQKYVYSQADIYSEVNKIYPITLLIYKVMCFWYSVVLV